MNFQQQEVTWSTDLLPGDWADGEGSGKILHRDRRSRELPQTHAGSQWRRCGTFCLSPPSHTIAETTIGEIQLAHLSRIRHSSLLAHMQAVKSWQSFTEKDLRSISVAVGSTGWTKMCQHFPKNTSKTASIPCEPPFLYIKWPPNCFHAALFSQ